MERVGSVIIASLFIVAILFVLWFSYYIKIHDYILIVVISLVTAWLTVYFDVTGDTAKKWVGWEWWTMLLFWTMAKHHRRDWRNPVFWASIAALLLVHLGASWLLLRNVEQFKPIWFVAIYLVEGAAISLILDWATRHFGKRRHQVPMP